MNNTSKPLCVGMSLAATWLSGNAWRREDSQVERLYDAHYYIQLAQLAEKAKFDFVFRPDSLFIDPLALAHSVGFSGLDPTLLMTAVATHTQHIGLLTTASTTFHSPYVIARQLQSLHHLSNGRAGWNVVTALDGHKNFGWDNMPDVESRYGRADEFVEAVKQLWDSFPNSALLHNRHTGQFADTDKIQPIHFKGEHLCCEGPLSIAGHSAGHVPLFQAGASDIGKAFAAKIAQGVFAATPDKDTAQSLRCELQSLATQLGRSAQDIRILPGLSLFIAETRQQAFELFKNTRNSSQSARHRALIADSLGIEESALPTSGMLDKSMMKPMQKVRSQTHSKLIRKVVEAAPIAIEELMVRPEVAGSGHWLIIGTVGDAVNEISAWKEYGAIDGFIALPGGSQSCYELVCERLMPALAKKGLVRQHYDTSTLLEHLNRANT
ncbi:MAG: NtaA/DmoA family FMN-dependent monooxygenase [Paraglaciecola sp.]|uniref:NtaA/DmoA family FMN-dependent monooxygenase n=1 Tax=Paraglaciecola sp. TaxID=1920173 RepID=UPI0032978A53